MTRRARARPAPLTMLPSSSSWEIRRFGGDPHYYLRVRGGEITEITLTPASAARLAFMLLRGNPHQVRRGTP